MWDKKIYLGKTHFNKKLTFAKVLVVHCQKKRIVLKKHVFCRFLPTFWTLKILLLPRRKAANSQTSESQNKIDNVKHSLRWFQQMLCLPSERKKKMQKLIANSIFQAMLKGNVGGFGGRKVGLDWVKTRCLVIIKHLTKPYINRKLQYSIKFMRYPGRVKTLFYVVSWPWWKFSWGILAGTEQFKCTFWENTF